MQCSQQGNLPHIVDLKTEKLHSLYNHLIVGKFSTCSRRTEGCQSVIMMMMANRNEIQSSVELSTLVHLEWQRCVLNQPTKFLDR